MLQQGCLKVQPGAQPQPIRGNAGMLEIGEASYKIYTDYIQNVIDTDSGFEIGLAAKGIRGQDPLIVQGEFHLFRVSCRIVLRPDAAKQDLAFDDFPEPKFLE
jgi:hypothetical protein